MSKSATIKSNFTSHGKESEGFNDNVNKIIEWRKKYLFPEGVENIFNALNYSGRAGTHYIERIYYVAYVLVKEGYEVTVKTN